MAISKRPKGGSAGSEPFEEEISALIGGGMGRPATAAGKPMATAPVAVDRDMSFTFRMPVSLDERIKAAIQDGGLKIPRQTWIQEAIVERLRKEGF